MNVLRYKRASDRHKIIHIRNQPDPKSYTYKISLKIIYLKPPIISYKRRKSPKVRLLDQKSNSEALMRGDRQNYTGSPCRPVTHLLFHVYKNHRRSFGGKPFASFSCLVTSPQRTLLVGVIKFDEALNLS